MTNKQTNTKDSAYMKKFMLWSLGAFLLFMVLLFAVIPRLFGHPFASEDIKTDVYLRDNNIDGDPLVTAVPLLKDIIAGPLISADDPLLGPATAPVTIAVYTDFTCWYCGQTLQIARTVQAEFGDQVRLAHKDFPNTNKAYASYQAAIAGRCAQRQDKFWELSERLYEHYDSLSIDTFRTLAKNLGLDMQSYDRCINGETELPITTSIDDNISEANALGIIGVPLVYVNNRELPADITYEELKAAVERELQ